MKVLHKSLIILLILSLITLGFLGYRYFRIKSQYQEAGDFYQTMADTYTENSEDENERNDYPDWVVDEKGLKEENSDYLCWLYVPDADVSLPVVSFPSHFNSNPDYYLYHTMDGTWSYSGTLFTRQKDLSGYVTYIYGHNMYDGSMFGKLIQMYQNELVENGMYVFQHGQWQKYDIQTMLIVNEDSELFLIPNNEEQYTEYWREVSSLASSEAAAPNTKTLVLSTCYGGYGTNQRLLIFGVK